MNQLLRQNFKITTPGVYDFEGTQINVFDKVSNYGSGKKTVYSFVVNGVFYEKKDITFIKRLFGVEYSGAKHATPAPKQEPKQEPAPAPKQEPAPKQDDEIKHARFDAVLNCARRRQNVYIYGPAGSGKNVIGEQIARALNLPFYCCAAVTNEFALDGFVNANGDYCPTEFYKAFTTGGVFFFDEFDASDAGILNKFNSVLANRYYCFPGKIGMKTAHKDFVIIAAGNTAGKGATEAYAGRQVIDAATLDRFKGGVIRVNYDSRVEEKIANGDSAALDFIRNMRKAAATIGYNLILGYRAIKALVSAAKENVFTPAELIDACITTGADQDIIIELAKAYPGDKMNRYYRGLQMLSTFETI